MGFTGGLARHWRLTHIVWRDVGLSPLFTEGDRGRVRITTDPERGGNHRRGQGCLAEVAIGTRSIRSLKIKIAVILNKVKMREY